MIHKFYRWKAKRKQIQHDLYLAELNKLLEEYETHKILNTELSSVALEDARKELTKNQMEYKARINRAKFFKSI